MHRQREFNNKMSDIDHVSTHPCHRLSIPSARVFWCRHCMQQFEDPISRWRHSKTCKPSKCPYNMSQKVDKEADALRLATGGQVLLKAKLEPTIPDRSNKSFPYQCYICKQAFDSLQRMRMHVRYPCNRVGDVQSPPLEAEDEYVIATRKKETDWQTKFNMFCTSENELQDGTSVHVITNESCDTEEPATSCHFYPAAVSSNVTEEHVFVPSDEQVIHDDQEQPDIMSVCETVVSSSPNESTSTNREKVITVQGIEVLGTTDELYLSELLMQLSRGGFLFQNDANKGGAQQSGTEQEQNVEVVIQQPGQCIEQHPGDIQVVIEGEQIPEYIQNQTQEEIQDDTSKSYTPEQGRTEEQYTNMRVINSAKTNQLRILAAVTQDDLHKIEQNQVAENHISNETNVYENRNMSYNSGAFSSGEHTVDQNPENFVSNQLQLLASVTSERLQSVVSEKSECRLLHGEQNTVGVQHEENNVAVPVQEVAVCVHSETDAEQQDASNIISAQTITESSSIAESESLPQENSSENMLDNQVYHLETIEIQNDELQKRKHSDDTDDANKRHKPESVS